MSDYGKLTGPGRLEFKRRFPAGIDRVWQYLVDPELRATWFCAGRTDHKVGGTLIFDFDHRRLSNRAPPPSHGNEQIAQFEGEILEFDPPHRLAFTWPEVPGVGGSRVLIQLSAIGDSETELLLIHEGLDTPEYRDGATAGWHAHFDLLDDLLSGRERRDFWDRHEALEKDYAARS